MTIRPLAGPTPEPAPIEPLLDHLVYATVDLEATISEFRAATRLEPAAGGRHVGLGTRNMLVALGETSYLEIIGPDRDNPPAPGATMPFGIAGLAAPRLVTWAVHPPDIARAAAAAAGTGADLGPITAMQRRRPDGVVLSWRLTVAPEPPGAGVVPFLIDWGTSPHPAEDSLPAAQLIALRGTHPEPAPVARTLAAMGVHLAVAPGAPALTAVIRTPGGTVELR